METIKKEPYHIANKAYLTERRLLSYHAKGFNKDFIKSLEEKYGLTGAIDELKRIKKQVKNDTFKQYAKKHLLEAFATFN